MLAQQRRNQLEPRRKLRLPRGPGDHDVARLHRLAQHIQHAARILGDLVQEQDPMMGQRDFPRPGRAAAAHQCHGGGRVVRSPVRPLAPPRDVESPAQGLHGSRLQRLILRHRRQDAGKARGQHRLARARRADQQHAVLSGCGHLHGAPRLQLSLDVAEIRVWHHAAGRARHMLLQAASGIAAAEMGADLQQGARWQDLRLRHQCGLVRIGGGQDEAARRVVALAVALHGAGHGQGAANGQQLP